MGDSSDTGEKMYRTFSPIPGPDAFEEHGKDAELSQAAFVLASSAGVGGYAEVVPEAEEFPLPDLPKLHRKTPIKTDRAMKYLDVESREMLGTPDLRIAPRDAAPLARDLMDKPDAVKCASLVEASMHNPSRLVRTAAAASAIDTTGPREDVLAVLVESAGHRDHLIRDVARTALARVQPDHPKLKRLKGR